jgi:hypothetical protein
MKNAQGINGVAYIVAQVYRLRQGYSFNRVPFKFLHDW